MSRLLGAILAGTLVAASILAPRAVGENKNPPSPPPPASSMTMMPEMPEKSFLLPSLPASAEYVPGVDEKFPRLRYPDGQISLNDRCPVRHAKLNPKMAPVYVNGKPIGFC